MRKTRSEIPDSIECQGPDIKGNCLFYINCAIFFTSAVSMVPEFWKLLPGQSIGYNLLYSLIRAEIIKELVQHASGKSDPVLISAYVLDTRPDFLCSFQP